MQIIFDGLCSGTETKHSEKSGKDYQITSFVEMPAMKSFQFFGNFELVASLEVKRYTFEASVGKNGNLEFPRLVSVAPVPAPLKKNEPVKA